MTRYQVSVESSFDADDEDHAVEQLMNMLGTDGGGYVRAQVLVDGPMSEALSFVTDQSPTDQQRAWHAVVHLLVPEVDRWGTPVDDVSIAMEYISETLRGQFLDWAYVADDEGALQEPIETLVCKPYLEGTFLDDEEV